MNDELRLLAITAHPDDETLGIGGVLARYQAEGIETYLVVATRGERGWQGPPGEGPGLDALGKLREAELMAAGKALGLKEVILLDYIDGDLDQADPRDIVPQISAHIRRIRPQVVITFPLDGAYGHPDHIAISQFAMSAVVHASGSINTGSAESAHQVQKFYYFAWDQEDLDKYEAIFGNLIFVVDGHERGSVAWEPWIITTTIDTVDYWETVQAAVACHISQLETVPGILGLDAELKANLWGAYKFVRVYSLVNGGRHMETDLFEGLR